MRTIKNCKVCVVGGAGFLGSHLVDHLVQDRNCEVLVIDNLVAGRREFVNPKAMFLHHDITGSEDYLRGVFRSHGIEYVFNYAAYPYIPDSFARPVHVFNVNASGAIKVINAAQEAGCKGILQVSSAEIYGDDSNDTHEDGIGEEFPVVPHSSYGASKAAVDALVQVRWKEAKTPVIALRQFNCVGERETHPYIVPEIIGQLNKQGITLHNQIRGAKDQPAVVLLGNNSFRDFLYAGDAVEMAMELLEKGQFGVVYNLGSQEGVKMYDLAKLIGKVMGFSDVKVVEDPSRKRPWEIWHLLSDNGRIHSVIDARPTVGLEEALSRAVTWYRGNGCKWPWEKRT